MLSVVGASVGVAVALGAQAAKTKEESTTIAIKAIALRFMLDFTSFLCSIWASTPAIRALQADAAKARSRSLSKY
jgi:hypothetical protein